MSNASYVLPLLEKSRLFSASKTVLAAGVDFPGANYQWRQKSDAATSVSSDVPSSPGGRRRVSKEERHALVESYVNEYRKRNNGKFPSAKDAMKHAGGGYYVVRKIVQELEYASRSPQLSSRTRISAESDHGHVVEEVVLKHTKLHVKRANEGVEDASISSVKMDSHYDEEDYLHETDLKKSNAKKVEQREVGSDVDPTAYLRNHTKKLEESATLEANQHSSQSHSDPEVSDRRKEEAGYSGETSFWGSMKTLADGFMSMWRRK
ncbi:hypothetical protein MLD38_021742 [Melastoma candidum]|uniref:Uncharacterized protein n=1 Tax=Melastoma candidum TaxID=119954 RepID=A0ACB9QI79_9MYRT|nr:hypothetical protein MLD38_021742 [Melastoma candidum]